MTPAAGRLAVRDVAHEDLVHTVEPAIDPMVELQLLAVLPLSRVLEAEAAACVPLAARELRAGREERSDEVGVRALRGAGPLRVERPPGHGPLDVTVHLPGHTRKERRAVVALANDAGARICARTRPGERGEAALVLTTNGVRAVLVLPNLVGPADLVGRPRPEAAAVVGGHDLERDLPALGLELVAFPFALAVARIGSSDGREGQCRNEQSRQDQPASHVLSSCVAYRFQPRRCRR